jgi:hypothetical protein
MNNSNQAISATQALLFCIRWAFKYPWMVVVMINASIFSILNGSILPLLLKKIVNIAAITPLNEFREAISPTVIKYRY